jgi:hypothetical protein
MRTRKRDIHGLPGVLLALLLSWLITAGGLSAGEAVRKAPGQSERNARFILTVDENLVSLQATDASIKEVLEEIGRRMNIEVVARLPAEERMTLAFDKLPIAEAVKRFGKHVNYAVLEDGSKRPGRVIKITIFSKREGAAPPSSASRPAEEAPRPEPVRRGRPEPEDAPQAAPFAFELNPAGSAERRR